MSSMTNPSFRKQEESGIGPIPSLPNLAPNRRFPFPDDKRRNAGPAFASFSHSGTMKAAETAMTAGLATG